MRSSKPWLMTVAFLLVLAFSASSALATGYVRGYVKPSGDGATCSSIDPSDPTPPTPSCVDVSGNLLTFGTSPTLLMPTPTYQVVGAVGITAGSELDFTFAGLAPVNSPNSTFQVLGCGFGNEGSSPAGIYDSSDKLLSSHCTDLGSLSDAATKLLLSQLITDVTCANPANTICLTFSQPLGVNLPMDWFFTEAATGPAVISLTETFGPASTPTPEPASISLLVAGLLGMGLFRRKRPA
jgi:hypothetical protein